MHKNDKHSEAGERPGTELIAKMGELIGEFARKGQLLGGEVLGGSSTRTRLTFSGGQCTLKHGRHAAPTELPTATLLLKVASRDQAIGWAQRYGKILVDGEIEPAPVNEPWDLGFMPKPQDAPLRILMWPKADQSSEAG